MIDKLNVKDFITFLLVMGLFVLAFIVIKPIIFPIIYGILLGYLFFPLYKLSQKYFKNKYLSASFICIGLLIIIVAFFSILISSLLKQAFNFYFYVQKVDLVTTIMNTISGFFPSEEIARSVAEYLNRAVSKLLASSLNNITDMVLNTPKLVIDLFITAIVFFFSLIEGESAIKYIQSLSPLKKEVEEKFFKQFKDITSSVIYGHIFVGFLQGILTGVGLWIFGIPQVLLLTTLACLFAVMPLIGAWIIWVPSVIYLLIAGKTGAAIGLFLYGTILVSWVDNVIRPYIVSRRTQINTVIIMIGMLGGLFVFGFLGIIIGPLVLAYVLLVFEIYKKTNGGDSLIFKKSEC